MIQARNRASDAEQQYEHAQPIQRRVVRTAAKTQIRMPVRIANSMLVAVELEGRRELLQDLLGDRLMAEERAAEVAAHGISHVIEVFDECRTVEPSVCRSWACSSPEAPYEVNITVTASPGSKCVRKKTSVANPKMTGIERGATRRRT